jgi:23S rRNA pseudouridine1911/1915/1917 synthase
VEILYKDKNLVAVYKEAGIASASDPCGDKDAMAIIREMLRRDNESDELYLIHRLDRVVGGVLVYARSAKYAALLSELVALGRAEKEYIAVVEGEADSEGVMEDLLYKDARTGKAFVVDRKRNGVKSAKLSYELIAKKQTEKGFFSLVRIRLVTGRFHQIRVQFSHRKMSIVGDGKYGSKDNLAKMPALFASRLSFSAEGRDYEFKKMPDTEDYPWNCFKELL